MSKAYGADAWEIRQLEKIYMSARQYGKSEESLRQILAGGVVAKKIEFIKELRMKSSPQGLGPRMGLKEAKDIVEAVWAGKTLPEVLSMIVDNTPSYVVEDIYNSIHNARWEELDLPKTKIGKLVYV